LIDPGKGHFQAVVSKREFLSPSCVLLTLERPEDFPDARPGHFVSIRIASSFDPLLRRPYSIMDLTGSELVLLIKVIGRGSALLAGRNPGEELDIIGPLGGNVFPEPEGGEAVLVAGGTGLAPVLFAARIWRNADLHLVYGAACAEEILESIVREGFASTHFSTLDGSLGYHGDAVSLCAELVNGGKIGGSRLYSCGPKGMVSGLEARLGRRFPEHYTSLETIMACGVGACRGCTVPVKSENPPVYRSVCADGTVFRAGEIAWEDWED
jgi:dihydroorotate dehydrogenase electron transfer subunit